MNFIALMPSQKVGMILINKGRMDNFVRPFVASDIHDFNL